MTLSNDRRTDGLIPVEPHIVLYAIRYGLGRATSAHTDALALIQQNWTLLRGYSDTILADLAGVLRNPHRNATASELRETAELITWIEENG